MVSFFSVFRTRLYRLVRTTASTLVVLWAFAALHMVCAPLAAADNWQGNLYDTSLPAHVVAVDKARQLFFLYEKESPLTLKFRYPCTTGQKEGDKQVINDLRTPEGIYFVDYKISSGLDFREYGGIAYTLNYPNPVDKLRGKTGHGIWIHSKGFGIVPRDTRGCIAIGLKDIDEAGPLLKPGTPVVVAEHFPTENVPEHDNSTAKLLKRRMDQWTRTWASRSAKMFDFYDGDAYTRAMPESFAAFRANKERLFKIFSWINIFNREVHVLEGPGYWVTWSEQFYRAPNLSTEGIRRLYWQKDAKGQYRIVGMEWLPRNLGMQAAYLKGQLVASAENTTSDVTASEAPVPPPISLPEVASETAPAAPGTALDAGSVPTPTEALPQLPKQPVMVATGEPQPQPDPDMVPAPATPAPPASVAELAPTPAPAPTPTPVTQTPVTPEVSAPASPATPAAPEPLTLNAEVTTRLQQDAQGWFTAFETQSPDLYDFYDETQYGKLPGVPKSSFKAFKAEVQRWMCAPWVAAVQGRVTVSVQGAYYTTSAGQWFQLPKQPPQQGVRTLYWLPDANGEMHVVGGSWQAGEQYLQAAYLEKISTPITRVIEDWRKAWEEGDVDAYMSFYAPDARQQGRGVDGIRAQKTLLWTRNAPKQVQLTGLRFQVEPNGVRADMAQNYTNQSGAGDKGIKTLLLRPVDGQWRICKEEWAAQPPSPAGAPAAAPARSGQRR